MALAPSPVAGPFAGLVVVDLTHVLSGPYCTMLLAELGARVIKIEAPAEGDVARRLGPFIDGRSAYFMTFNRGKESLALDLKNGSDRSVFERLLDVADVLVENFTPGVMDRLGYGWEALHARHPRLVYAAVSGFGRTGPLAGRKANDLIAQAMGGLMSVTGHPGGPPTRAGTAIGDMAAGVFAAYAVAAALYDREHSGCGRLIDVSMLDCQVALLEHAIARYEATGESPGPMGSKHTSAAPFGVYDTADGHIALATAIDKDFRVLAASLGRPDLPDDPRFASMPKRAANAAALDEIVAPILARETTAHWLELFEEAEVRAAPIQTVEEILRHPQVRARNIVVTADDPVIGPFRMPGNPVKMPAFPDPPTRRPAPDLDADRARVLAELDDTNDRQDRG